MIDLYELKQLVAFADLGTLSRVAEMFHNTSTPSVTLVMQHLEQYFGAPLFCRSKNRIELNDTGRLAVDYARNLLHERLSVSVRPQHELSRHESLTFADINGFHFLLRTELGFWDALCREKIPDSKFLAQTDIGVFDELVHSSSLPCFTTDYGHQNNIIYPDRVNIPLTDSEANVTFYMAAREDLHVRIPTDTQAAVPTRPIAEHEV